MAWQEKARYLSDLNKFWKAESKDDLNVTVSLEKCTKNVYQKTDKLKSISEETSICLKPVWT